MVLTCIIQFDSYYATASFDTTCVSSELESVSMTFMLHMEQFQMNNLGLLGKRFRMTCNLQQNKMLHKLNLKSHTISSPATFEKFSMVAPIVVWNFPIAIFEEEYVKSHRSFPASNRIDHHMLFGS